MAVSSLRVLALVLVAPLGVQLRAPRRLGWQALVASHGALLARLRCRPQLQARVAQVAVLLAPAPAKLAALQLLAAVLRVRVLPRVTLLQVLVAQRPATHPKNISAFS
ncbi:MAG: hypothetical protein RL701_6818 [Pseudomonadota bacterium]